MALQRKRIGNGVGMIGSPPRLVLGSKGEITVELVQLLNSFLQDIVGKLNGFLSEGTGEHATQSGNQDGQWIEGITPSVADTEFRVPHGLNRRPIGFDVRHIDKGGVIYSSSSGSWNSEVLFLKCTTVTTTYRILIT